MSIPNSIKKNITKDWIGEFPSLSAYAQDKLYKVVGPVIIGIEIFKQPRAEDYRPYFVSYSLWDKDLRECLREPAIQQEIRNSKGMLFDIPYLKHANYFNEVVRYTHQQLLIPIDGDVTLKALFEMINSQFSHTLVKSSPVGQAKLYEFKLFVALYVNDTGLVNDVFDEVKRAAKNWMPNLFEWKFGKLDAWLQGLQEKVNNREGFLKQVAANKLDKKISQLKSSELVI